MSLPAGPFDVAVVGAGVVGLAHALACARRGLSVVVIDRDTRANGASIRNFGFVTVSGQEEGAMWRRARRSRDVWLDLAAAAGIPIHQRGMLLAARRPEAAAVLESFAAGPMAEGCELLGREASARRFPGLAGGVAAALVSPHELRVEPREAIPRIAAHLAAAHGVTFVWGAAVTSVEPGEVGTSRGSLAARQTVVAPGDDATALFPDLLAPFGLTRCKLQMMRVRPSRPALPHVLMSDLSLLRYGGFAALPASGALRARLERDAGPELAAGIHLIVAAARDGTCVIGDSHVYDPTPDPFADSAIDRMILDSYEALLGERPAVTESWTGTYASAPATPVVVVAPAPEIRVVTVATGAGMSCSFALAEEIVEAMGS
ncbi:TIGR03364 family FAD-dependent oxidoreductase [Enterovirga sp.]|uniref:TIGR03364 family FAD-dependent oxidoreductase n=1 Tax=Enterovirga sp. TaxID=2026350 RepID=UPI00261E409B|nr:TIGR03364 family FAD-dependent oxidoreductase [Enterovirga sp.]MDB5592338.1 FAD-dependent oxidoreductase [Enterovirga sp.]